MGHFRNKYYLISVIVNVIMVTKYITFLEYSTKLVAQNTILKNTGRDFHGFSN